MNFPPDLDLTHKSVSDDSDLDLLLPLVEKPARYVGREVNAVKKDPSRAALRMALAFPDVYEVGMSHLGLKILYSIVNQRPDCLCERAFAPWPDMEALMRRHNKVLATLETRTPLNRVDLVGFSLQYELCATSVLQMLELGGIPIRAADRGDRDPFVVGGGPVASNPLPLEPFFDAFVIGDGEEAILDIADAQIAWKNAGRGRDDLLSGWKEIPGVYVPKLHGPGDVVHRRITADLDKAPFPTSLAVPFCETVHDRIGVEIARGCTRGCRFCQAGMLYRPVRERYPETILRLAKESLAGTGWEEVALLSLSTGDYSGVVSLIERMAADLSREMTALSLPSLRTETFDESMAEEIRKVRKTGFTLAPEAGTDRLRRIINKGNTEEDLERAVKAAFRHGWTSVKLYFMIGLPFETDEDIAGIVDLIHKAARWAGRGRITASISTFVPKAHTPFQWAEQISPAEAVRRRTIIRDHCRRGNVKLKFHDPRTSFLEGVLARGDGRLSEVVERVFRKGARFDGWDEHLAWDLWTEAFEDLGIVPEAYLAGREPAEELPWDFIDTGVHKEYLLEEWRKAAAEASTPDCRFEACAGCGVCDFDRVMPRLAKDPLLASPPGVDGPSSGGEVTRFRLRYEKVGALRFLGHQDVIRLFHRAFRRAGLRLDYSKGFHPHPKLRFSPPLAVGVESVSEYLEFDLISCDSGDREVFRRLADALPEGVNPLKLEQLLLNDSPISAKVTGFVYEITSPANGLSREEIAGRVSEFIEAPRVELVQVRKGRTRQRDLKEWIDDVRFDGEALKVAVRAGQSGSIHPVEALAALLRLDRDTARHMRIIKTDVIFSDDGDSAEV